MDVCICVVDTDDDNFPDILRCHNGRDTTTALLSAERKFLFAL